MDKFPTGVFVTMLEPAVNIYTVQKTPIPININPRAFFNLLVLAISTFLG
jgi:hypothetical protein